MRLHEVISQEADNDVSKTSNEDNDDQVNDSTLDDELVVGGDESSAAGGDQPAIEQCAYCNIGFLNRTALRNHHAEEHADEEPLLDDGDQLQLKSVCTVGAMVFADMVDQEAHFLTEHDAIEAKCDECGEKFTSQRHFDEHQLEHDLTGK